MKRLTVLFISVFMSVAAVQAASTEDTPAELAALLKQIVPGQAPDAINTTPLSDVYEVVYGTNVFYFSADGRYMLRGDLIDLKSGSNLSERQRGGARLKALAGVDEKSMIVYPAKGEPKHVLTVFTDVDCPYCRKLHDGMKQMNEMGIEVRYLGFPRAGAGSPTFKKMVSIWCAEDPRAAMDAAKAGKAVPEAECEQDFSGHMALVQQLGINGTPALLLDDGRMVNGYVPPEKLQQILAE